MGYRKKIDHRQIELSHLDKVLFPKSQITKGDVIQYYEKIAPYFLPRVHNHLIVMNRFPSGIGEEGFFQKQVPDYFPSWLKRGTVDLRKGEQQSLVLVRSVSDLVYLANQAVLVFHSWLSPANKIEYPDKIVFDLDPSGTDLKIVRVVARLLKGMLEEHQLVPFVMTTGSRGYHVVVPIRPRHTFDKIHSFAKHIAYTLAEQYPKQCTVEMSKSKRKGKVFIDYLRNSYGQTSVSCYSVRAREGAPVATPIDWDELSKVKPQRYTIATIFKRLARKEDPWKEFDKKANNLSFDEKECCR